MTRLRQGGQMWVLWLAMANLGVFAAAAGALLLATGCEWLSRWGGVGWLRGPARALRAVARGLTLALVLVVLGSVLALVLAIVQAPHH